MKHIFIVQVSLVFIAIVLFLTIAVPPARATVETNWPVDKQNICREADDFFIDFEAGIEEIEIESTIPSLKFTTTSGLNWRYADIRTGKYNAYPYGSQSYEIRGNFGAWLGVTGDAGRIDFPGGGATYFSALVSTSSGVIVDAYNSEDELIANSGQAGSNINTRTFTRLTVDAPAGDYISYVIIHDTGNFWVMDELCTDANKAVLPVPGRTIGEHSDRFDIVFVPDNDYGLPADTDTWLPTFLDHINHQIDERLGGASPVSGNLDKFNFYYTRMQGDATPEGGRTLPADLTLLSTFADAYVIFHTDVFGDSTLRGPPSIYGAEGPVGRSFIHESGHGIFGLADEYDDESDGCPTARIQPDPMPNVWATEALGRADATNEGWNPDDIWMFTTCQDDWWKLGTTEYIMFDGAQFAYGWGDPASRRIQWFLDQFPAAGEAATEAAQASPQSEKAIWLNLDVSSGEFNLLDESYVIDSAPNYLPGKHDFTAKVFSTSGGLLGEYGFNDPRRILAESGYQGPTWLDSVNFQLILPYFNSGSRVDLIESETGSVKLSVDISQYATPPTADIISPITTATLSGTSGNNGWYTSDVQVTLTATDNEGGLGVNETEYSFDNTTWNTYTTPFNITTEGLTTLYYYSTDNAGNVEPTKNQTVKIDKTPPNISISGVTDGSYYNYNVTPVINIIDANLYTQSITLNGAPYISGTAISSEGSYTLITSATDLAGNNASKTVNFTIDKTPPEADIRFNTTLKDIKVYNTETGSEASYTILPTKKGKDGKELPDDDGETGWEYRQYTLKDLASNSLVLVLEYKMGTGAGAMVKIVSLQYNSDTLINPTKNNMQVGYTQGKNGAFKELGQRIQVNKLFNIEAKYSAQKGKTEIKINIEGQKPQTATKKGIVILELLTDKSGLKYRY